MCVYSVETRIPIPRASQDKSTYVNACHSRDGSTGHYINTDSDVPLAFAR